jgi:hypothetical protein
MGPAGNGPLERLGRHDYNTTTYFGASVRFLSQMNRDPQSHFIGFDSLEGLLENFSTNWPKGRFDVGGAIPQIDSSV